MDQSTANSRIQGNCETNLRGSPIRTSAPSGGRGGNPCLNYSGRTGKRGGSSSEESSTNVEMEISFAEATTPSGSPPRPLSPEETEQSRKSGLATTVTRSGQYPVGRARGPPTCNDHR